MQVAVVSMVRNEEDIIESFVRHCVRFANRIHIIDHDSTDATPKILTALQEEGLPLTLEKETEYAHIQKHCITRGIRYLLSETSYDWIFPLDADEFLTTDNGVHSLPDCLHLLSRQKHYGLRRINYLPMESDDEQEPNPLRRIRYRELFPTIPSKILVSGTVFTSNCESISQGNHAMETPDGSTLFPDSTMLEIWIAHFPLRTRSQAISLAEGWQRNLARKDPEKHEQAHRWKLLAQLLQNPSREIHLPSLAHRIYLDEEQAGTLKLQPFHNPPEVSLPMERYKDF